MSDRPICTCPCIHCSNQAHWMCHGEGVEIDTVQSEPMTDLQARIADAIHLHWFWPAGPGLCAASGCTWRGPQEQHADHLAALVVAALPQPDLDTDEPTAWVDYDHPPQPREYEKCKK